MSKPVHKAGALGFLLQSGQIKSVDSIQDEPVFETESGISFKETELISIPTNQCEPWKYANRLDSDIGDIDNLVKSIKENNQLQPVLVRPHPEPHNGIKYEIIFGRRRFLACKQLNIPLIAICKNISSLIEAVSLQNAENKFRENVSNYSTAIHYKQLLEDKIFISAKSLAEHLNISPSSLNELLIYTKIPDQILSEIPDVHDLSINLALCIHSLLKENIDNYELLLKLAPKIGKEISSSDKLKKALKINANNLPSKESSLVKKIYTKEGSIIGNFSILKSGDLKISLNKNFAHKLHSNFFQDELLNLIITSISEES